MNSAQLNIAKPPAPVTPQAKRSRRPFGLYMILILLTLQGVIGVLATSIFGVGLLLVPVEAWAELDLPIFAVLEPLLLLAVTLVVVVGLWRYRGWGWYGMMLLLAYWMASDAVNYFTGQPDYGSMMLNVAMVFYLNQREVRDLFAMSAADEVNA